MNLNDLNPEQRKAAETLEGPVLILAGAGSGKTRALTYRVANLLSHGVKPWNILAITFTNKAAREMQQRVAILAGDHADGVWISTFHSMCARILRRDIEKLGYARSFSIYDDDDQASVLKAIYKQENIDDKLLPIKEAKAQISSAKNRLLDPDEWFEQSDKRYLTQKLHNIYYCYEQKLKADNALDFDDLLVKTVELFTNHPPVLEYYRNRFLYVHVDEYQDTNFAQYTLVKLITLQSRNLCVVGDDDQSIYGWRGADVHNILDFNKDYPDATVIRLEQNYRSTANILDAANQVIAHNAGRMEKTLWTEKEAGEPITLYKAEDERGEATWVCRQIEREHLRGRSYLDCLVLYRSNAQSRVIEETLMQAQVPYRIYGGLRFYDRKEIKDIVAYLRCIVNPADEVSLRRIINTPRRSIGDSTMQILTEYARVEELPLFSAIQILPEGLNSRAKKAVGGFADLMNDFTLKKEEMKLSEFVQYVISESGLRSQYESEKTDQSEENTSRIENIDEFLNGVSEYERASEAPTLESYLENVALITDMDRGEEQVDAVTLITIHSAKGLEYPVVFMVGMEEGIFPSSRSLDDPHKLEEERRLCYVAITRAKQKLYMSHAKMRYLYNQPNWNDDSRFLDEIPKRLFEGMQKKPAEKRQAKPAAKPAGYGAGQAAMGVAGVQKGFAQPPASADAGLFSAGDRVAHAKYGKGTVVETSGTGSKAVVVIRFDSFGEKTFSLAIAPIVKIK